MAIVPQNPTRAKQRRVIRALLAMIANHPDWDPTANDFQGVSLCDMTIQMNRWIAVQARISRLIEIVETRLAGAPFKMAMLCNELRAIVCDMAIVIQRANARMLMLQNV